MSFAEDVSVRALDSASVDAFGRWRTSHPATLFDSKLIIDNAPLRWDDVALSGAGTSSTYNSNQASVTLGVSNATAGVRVRQSKRRFGYQTSKSQLIFISSVLGAGAADIIRRVGYFDTNNGLFFELSGTTLNVVRRTYTSGSPVDTAVAQSAWNLDKLNGSGVSGVTLDTSKAQIFVIDFEWLGVGRVRMGVVIAGKIIYCHEFLNSNTTLAMVYMSVPNLPVRYEIRNGGTGAAANLVQICSAVISEGGQDDVGLTFGLSRGSTALTTLNDADIYPLIAIQYQAGREMVPIKILGVSATTASATFAVHVMLNPTVTGTALSFTNLTNSALAYDISRTNGSKVSGGTTLFVQTGISSSGVHIPAQSVNDISFGSTIAGVSDIIVIGVQRLVGATEAFYGAINWREMR